MNIKSNIAGRSIEHDEIIAEALALLIRKHLGQAMQACTRRNDPTEIEHYMAEATKVMQLRRMINA